MSVVSVDPLSWLEEHSIRRTRAGLDRHLTARPARQSVLDLASNDYLGLSSHPEVVAGAIAAVRRWGAGATGSRLVTGTTTDHEKLETELAEFTGAETGLVFSSGYTANVGAVTALSGREALLVSDAGCHASLVDACRLSRAQVAIAQHRDVAAVDRLLAERSRERALVLTDSVFSADGDVAPLVELHRVTRKNGAVLVVDEAHGLGVRGVGGRGLVSETGLAGEPDVIVTVTLSKALGAQGGAVLASGRVREHLVNTARTFVFDTGLAPAAVGGARAALRVLRAEPELAGRVLLRAADIADIVGVSVPNSAVIPVVLGSPERALQAARRCHEHGVVVGCFRPPAVPPGRACLRITARADLSEADLDSIATVLPAALQHTHVTTASQ